jgi:hypothetical protein
MDDAFGRDRVNGVAIVTEQGTKTLSLIPLGNFSKLALPAKARPVFPDGQVRPRRNDPAVARIINDSLASTL